MTLEKTMQLCCSLSTFRHTDLAVRDVLASAFQNLTALTAENERLKSYVERDRADEHTLALADALERRADEMRSRRESQPDRWDPVTGDPGHEFEADLRAAVAALRAGARALITKISDDDKNFGPEFEAMRAAVGAET